MAVGGTAVGGTAVGGLGVGGTGVAVGAGAQPASRLNNRNRTTSLVRFFMFFLL
jgi:hypothetical protein